MNCELIDRAWWVPFAKPARVTTSFLIPAQFRSCGMFQFLISLHSSYHIWLLCRHFRFTYVADIGIRNIFWIQIWEIFFFEFRYQLVQRLVLFFLLWVSQLIVLQILSLSKFLILWLQRLIFHKRIAFIFATFFIIFIKFLEQYTLFMLFLCMVQEQLLTFFNFLFPDFTLNWLLYDSSFVLFVHLPNLGTKIFIKCH